MTHAHRFLVPFGVVSLAVLPACFGTGVAPATRTALAVSDDVLVQPDVTVDLQVRNVGNKNVVAKNVRLHLGAHAARATGLRVDHDPACDALAPGATCVVHLTASPDAAEHAYPCVGEVRGDNTPSYPLELIDRLDPSRYPEGDHPEDGPGAAITLTDVRLAPPAPALASLTLRNASPFGATVQSLRLDANSHLALDTSSCPGYPHLGANSNCAVRVRAPNDAVPGTYVAKLSYEGPHGRGNAQGQVVVAAGELVVNGGVPVTLDGNTTVLSVPVFNAGFDLTEVAVSLPWTDTCRGQLSLNIDASACTSGLAANTDCTVLLSTLGATPGASSQVVARAEQTSVPLRAAQPVRIGSLQVNSVGFLAPGSATLRLDNLGTAPISVRDVRVGGNRSAGLPAPSRSDLAACQNFVGSCNVPIRAGFDAWVDGGASNIDVSYVADGIVQRSSGQLSVAPTSVVFSSSQPVALHAGVQTFSVTLTNVGPFGWVSPGLTTAPALRGVSMRTSTCGEVLPPSATCNITLATDLATPYNATATLQPTGANVRPILGPQVTTSVPAVLTGTAASGNTALVMSLDAGTSWTFAPEIEARLVRAALSESAWVAVGHADSGLFVHVSKDRGQSWQDVELGGGSSVFLDVAQLPDGFVAVGAGPDGGLLRRSADGVHWGASQNFANVMSLRAVRCAGPTCLATGVDNNFAGVVLQTNDGAKTWAPLTAGVVPPDFTGIFRDAAFNANVVVLAGDNANKVALYSSASGTGGPYTADVASGSVDGGLTAVAAGPDRWLVVGTDSGMQTVGVCNVAAGDAFATPFTSLGSGALLDAAWLDGGWTAVGHDGSDRGLLQRSLDGTSWTPSVIAGTTRIRGIAVGQ